MTIDEYLKLFTDKQKADELIAEMVRDSITYRQGYYTPYSLLECALFEYAVTNNLDISQPDIDAAWRA